MEKCLQGHHGVDGIHSLIDIQLGACSAHPHCKCAVLCFSPQHWSCSKQHERWLCRSDTSRKSRLGLLKRAAPQDGVRWIEVDPFVCFHTGAAWEDGFKVHMVISRCVDSILKSCRNRKCLE
jgi:carotenoid cleavage dioxygenase-like enzyme